MDIQQLDLQVLLVIGRVLYAAPLLFMGVLHFVNAKSMTEYAASKHIPLPRISVLFSGFLLAVGSIGVLFDIYSNLGGVLLVLFFVPVTIFMHSFWTVHEADKKMYEMTNFMKNLIILGAALMFAVM